jgi:hypothetical protein
MKKEQLSPEARDIFDMLVSTESVNMMAKIYRLPMEIRAQVEWSTTTVEERNLEILRLCFLYYVAKRYNKVPLNSIVELANKDFPNMMNSFIENTSRLILEAIVANLIGEE